MNGGKLERFFDTKFKKVMFRWILCILLAVSWIMKDVGVNKDFRIIFTSTLWIIYAGLCVYIFKNGIDIRYSEFEEWDKYRLELIIDIICGAIIVPLAVISFFR